MIRFLLLSLASLLIVTLAWIALSRDRGNGDSIPATAVGVVPQDSSSDDANVLADDIAEDSSAPGNEPAANVPVTEPADSVPTAGEELLARVRQDPVVAGGVRFEAYDRMLLSQPDDFWSGQMEATLRDSLFALIEGIDAEVYDIECRVSICRAVVTYVGMELPEPIVEVAEPGGPPISVTRERFEPHYEIKALATRLVESELGRLNGYSMATARDPENGRPITLLYILDRDQAPRASSADSEIVQRMREELLRSRDQ